jgi:dihydroorotate dehydrogenase
MVSEVRNKIGSKPIIIACGGISDEIDVWNCIAAGANLCQAYTALIFNGPSFAYNINKKLSALMVNKNLESLEKVRGQAMIKKMY